MGEHRVPMRGISRYPDPTRSPDPVVRHVVATLATLEPAPPMRAHFRAELRAQLVAVTPRLVTEGEPGASAVADTSVAAHPVVARLRRFNRLQLGRPVTVLVAAMAALVMLVGGAFLYSRNALPGDAMYQMKRAAEDVQMATTSGPVARGTLSLTFAARRISEVEQLVPAPEAVSQAGTTGNGSTGTNASTANGSGGAGAGSVILTASTSSLVVQTLASANDDVRRAAQLLGGAAVASRHPASLKSELEWLPGEITQLRTLQQALAPGSAYDQVSASIQLLQRAEARAIALIGEIGCSCLDTTASDQLGPVPCTVCASPGSGGPVTPTSLPPSSSAGTSGSNATSATSGAATPGQRSGSTSQRVGGNGRGSASNNTGANSSPGANSSRSRGGSSQHQVPPVTNPTSLPVTLHHTPHGGTSVPITVPTTVLPTEIPTKLPTSVVPTKVLPTKVIPTKVTTPSVSVPPLSSVVKSVVKSVAKSLLPSVTAVCVPTALTKCP